MGVEEDRALSIAQTRRRDQQTMQCCLSLDRAARSWSCAAERCARRESDFDGPAVSQLAVP